MHFREPTEQDELERECLVKVLTSLHPREADYLLAIYLNGRSERAALKDLAQSLGKPVSWARFYVPKLRERFAQQVRDCLTDSAGEASSISRLATLSPVIEQIKQLEPSLIAHLRKQTDDLIRLDPILFEHLFAEFLAARGFDDVRLVGRNTTSADIYAVKFVPADIAIKIFVEVKRWKHTIGIEVIIKF
jgi:hypothetical protein